MIFEMKAMGKRVAEQYDELFHYTTARGLDGILKTQQMRATNFAYLNDPEERVGFFQRRLPHLMDDAVRRAVIKIGQSLSGKRRISAMGGPAKAIDILKGNAVAALHTTSLKFDNPYITAFCGSDSHGAAQNGILSQWRAYGVDGAYAVVFRAAELERMIAAEFNAFSYQLMNFSDVDYDDHGANVTPPHPECLELEKKLQKGILDFLTTSRGDALNLLGEVVPVLSSRYKHFGFREEAEVRIVATPTNDALFEHLSHSGSDKRPRKPIEFEPRDGVLVPYLMLFGGDIEGKRQQLPISKIIVGPHADREKRQRAVQLLLKQRAIDAEVMVSDIPFLGH